MSATGEDKELPETDSNSYYSFCNVIASIIKRGVEEVEITSQEELKAKEKELQKLKRRVKHLEEVATRLEANQVPPLDLQETSTTEDQEECRSTVRRCCQKRDESEEDGHKTSPYGDSHGLDNVEDDENKLPSLQELLELIIPATHITQSEEKDVFRWEWNYQELIKCLEDYGLSLKKIILKEKKCDRRIQLQSTLKKVSDVINDLRKKVGRCYGESPAFGREVPPQWLISQALKHNQDWCTGPKDDVFATDNNNDRFDSKTCVHSSSEKDEDRYENVKTMHARNSKKKHLDLGSDETQPWCARKSNQVGQSPDTGRQSCSFVRYSVKTKRNHHIYNLYAQHKTKLKKLRKKYKRAARDLKLVAEAYRVQEAKMKTFESERKGLKEQQLALKKELISKEARIRELKGKLSTAPNVENMRVRLEAASQVMAKQHRQIAEAQKEHEVDLKVIENMKKRLSRAESINANKETLLETCRSNCHNMEAKLEAETTESSQLKTEVKHLQDAASLLRSQVASLEKENAKLQSEKTEREDKFSKLKVAMEEKVSALDAALRKKTAKSEAMEMEVQTKLSGLRAQFVARMQDTAHKLQIADDKIKELYRAIELFLRQVHEYNRSHKVTHGSPSPEAVKVACDILQLSPTEAEMILQADYDLITEWLTECNTLVCLKVFAEKLANFLFDIVTNTKEDWKLWKTDQI